MDDLDDTIDQTARALLRFLLSRDHLAQREALRLFWLALDQADGIVISESGRELMVPSVVLELQRCLVDRMRAVMLGIELPSAFRSSANEVQATIGPMFLLPTMH